MTQLTPAQQQAVIGLLSRQLLPRRWERLQHVLAHRTRHLTVLVEEIYQPHNASAVMRSCECFGVQDLHTIEDRNRYRINREVTRGSDKWITHHHHRGEHGPQQAMAHLRGAGYRLVAMTLAGNSVSIGQLPLEAPLAFCFGNEKQGLSPLLEEGADYRAHVPMVGFTQSLNISVSVALTLHAMGERLRASPIPWQLGEAESRELLLHWLRRSVKSARKLVARELGPELAELL